MEVGLLAGGIVAGLGVVGSWLDLRRRTNGHGPIATQIQQMKLELKEDILDGHSRTARVEERVARVEQHVIRCPARQGAE